MHNDSRRNFIKKSVFALASIPFMGLFGRSSLALAKDTAKEAALPAGQTPVPDTDAVAQALGYKPNAKDVDKKKYAQYKAGQNCKSCALYTASNDSWGKCQMLVNGLVNANGWCGSYNKKA